ncbi:GNAT family N-acetyltransferase [Glycomyces tritici]|uniref:GNAT family protein n=1 Tax=Glycomyces tritici TaxID=2665176 RepID=A0ABT7YX10_9ACTN|nr:GNAT family protein [Glycomyces tritici]MDN3243172.1 GNAT family protein [Glycomyces tritici]
MPISDVIPLYRLRINTARLALRLPHPDELPLLADCAREPIHAVGEEPFENPIGSARSSWSSAPPEDRARRVVQVQLGEVARWTADNWHLELGVWLDGKPIGVQTLYSKHFPVTREAVTISWLTLAQQGNGYGTEARAGVLGFAFDWLQARSCRSRSFRTNGKSVGVSERLGYRDDGIDVEAVYGGVARTSRRFRMEAADWRSRLRPPVTVTGFDGDCRTWFGLGSEGAGEAGRIRGHGGTEPFRATHHVC